MTCNARSLIFYTSSYGMAESGLVVPTLPRLLLLLAVHRTRPDSRCRWRDLRLSRNFTPFGRSSICKVPRQLARIVPGQGKAQQLSPDVDDPCPKALHLDPDFLSDRDRDGISALTLRHTHAGVAEAREAGANIVVLDDAFQHRRARRE